MFNLQSSLKKIQNPKNHRTEDSPTFIKVAIFSDPTQADFNKISIFGKVKHNIRYSFRFLKNYLNKKFIVKKEHEFNYSAIAIKIVFRIAPRKISLDKGKTKKILARKQSTDHPL